MKNTAETILNVTSFLMLVAGVAATTFMIIGEFTLTDIEGNRKEIDLLGVALSFIPIIAGMFFWSIARVILDISGKIK
jgi:hypothetical protein